MKLVIDEDMLRALLKILDYEYIGKLTISHLQHVINTQGCFVGISHRYYPARDMDTGKMYWRVEERKFATLGFHYYG
jgi:hypothetical protein